MKLNAVSLQKLYNTVRANPGRTAGELKKLGCKWLIERSGLRQLEVQKLITYRDLGWYTTDYPYGERLQNEIDGGAPTVRDEEV